MSAKGKKKAASAALIRPGGQNAANQAPDAKASVPEGESDPGKQKPVRKVWGRIKWQEVNGAAYSFEMRKAGGGGVFVRKKNSRTVEQVTFGSLIAGGGRSFTVAGDEGQAVFGPDGVMVRKRGLNPWKLVSWEALADCAKEQMTLFPGIE